jgi:hypothetical protein
VNMFYKNWKDLRYEKNHKAIAVNRDRGFYCCVRCRPGTGQCKYAICHGCRARADECGNTSSPFAISSYTERHIECKHEIENLELEFDAWWCNKDHIFSYDWFLHPHGCANCGGLFYNLGTSYKKVEVDDAKKAKFLQKIKYEMDEEKYVGWVEASECKQENDAPSRYVDALELDMEI